MATQLASLPVGLIAERRMYQGRLHQSASIRCISPSKPESPPKTPSMDDHDLKSQQHSHAPSGFLQDTPPRADVDEILRRKRKAREYKVSMRAALKADGEKEYA